MTAPHRASNMQRTWLCPPSPWREADMPELDAGDAANEGSLLHDQIARAIRFGDVASSGDSDHRWIVNACLRRFHELRYGAPENPDGDNFLIEHEESLLDHNLIPIIERKIRIDATIFHDQGRAIVIDWKTGRAEPEWDAQRDLQLLCYAVAVRNTYDGIDCVQVYRFHPRLFDENRETSVEYAGGGVYWIGFENVLKSVVARSGPKAQANPGNAQCLYCKAKLACPEFRAWAEPKDNELPAVVNAALTPAMLAQVLDYKDRFKLLSKVMEDAEGLAKRAIAQGIEIPGWTLKESGSVREIPDAIAARNALAQYMPAEAIDGASKLSVTRLESAFKAATGLRGKSAEREFNTALAGLIEKKPKSASLIKKGELQ